MRSKLPDLTRNMMLGRNPMTVEETLASFERTTRQIAIQEESGCSMWDQRFSCALRRFRYFSHLATEIFHRVVPDTLWETLRPLWAQSLIDVTSLCVYHGLFHIAYHTLFEFENSSWPPENASFAAQIFEIFGDLYFDERNLALALHAWFKAWLCGRNGPHMAKKNQERLSRAHKQPDSQRP